MMIDGAAAARPEGRKRWWLPIRQRKASPVAAVASLILALLIAGPGTGCGSTRDDGGDEAGTEVRAAPDRILLEMAGGIAAVNADGSGYKRLTDGSYGQEEGSGDWGVAWSPDGLKIAFDSTRDDGVGDIYVMNSNGTSQTRLTTNGAKDEEPSWSPDGTKIAFTSTRDGGYEEIYIMNPDGTGQARLTNNAVDDLYPDWSPDGTKISFHSYFRAGDYEIYVMNSNGSGETRLTNVADTDGTASWSPDGTKIAFLSYRDGNFEIYVMNSDGTGQTRLTNNSVFEDTPDWQPLAAAPGPPAVGGIVELRAGPAERAAASTGPAGSDYVGPVAAAAAARLAIVAGVWWARRRWLR